MPHSMHTQDAEKWKTSPGLSNLSSFFTSLCSVLLYHLSTRPQQVSGLLSSPRSPTPQRKENDLGRARLFRRPAQGTTSVFHSCQAWHCQQSTATLLSWMLRGWQHKSQPIPAPSTLIVQEFPSLCNAPAEIKSQILQLQKSPGSLC